MQGSGVGLQEGRRCESSRIYRELRILWEKCEFQISDLVRRSWFGQFLIEDDQYELRIVLQKGCMQSAPLRFLDLPLSWLL